MKTLGKTHGTGRDGAVLLSLHSPMKILRLLLAIASLGLGASAASAMNNTDVVKMVKAELDEDTILLAIGSAKTAEFDISASALVELKDKNVGEKVIQAMIKKQSGGGSGEEVSPAPAPVPRIKYKNVDDNRVLPPVIDPVKGQEYFTRYTFKYEDTERPTTNYWRGETVPINTKVLLVDLGKNSFTIKFVESGVTLKVENVEKHSKRPTLQVAREMLSAKPTEIEKYGKEMEEALRAGTLRLGMTKTQVLLARGYPPGHETPSLEGDTWKFWSSRFVYQTLVFNDGILTQGRGLY
jgi:hypothetical protein